MEDDFNELIHPHDKELAFNEASEMIEKNVLKNSMGNTAGYLGNFNYFWLLYNFAIKNSVFKLQNLKLFLYLLIFMDNDTFQIEFSVIKKISFSDSSSIIAKNVTIPYNDHSIESVVDEKRLKRLANSTEISLRGNFLVPKNKIFQKRYKIDF